MLYEKSKWRKLHKNSGIIRFTSFHSCMQSLCAFLEVCRRSGSSKIDECSFSPHQMSNKTLNTCRKQLHTSPVSAAAP